MGTGPGAGFYVERLERVRALPEAARSADVQQWLRLHDQLETALAALPELPASATAQRPLVQSVGGNVALAALLRFITAAFADSAHDPLHPMATLGRLAPQLPPFFKVWQGSDHQATLEIQPELVETLGRGLEADDADLEVVTRMMLVAIVSAMVGQQRVGVDALGAIQQPLFESEASLDQQLAALRQRCGDGGSGSGGGGSNLPTVAQLQAAWAALVIELGPMGVRQGLSQAVIAAFGEQAARDLLSLQPDNPRSSFELGKAAVVNATTGSASRLLDPLPHFQRGAELARAQGSDFSLARCCWMAAVVATSDSSPAVSPVAAAALMEEGDAAHTRCKKLVPPSWAAALKADRAMCSPVKPIIERHLQHSPDAWQAAVRREALGQQQQRIERVLARLEEGKPTCDGCGLPAAQLKWCPCHLKRYCSKGCQIRARAAHAAECNRALAARGGGA